MYVHNYLQKSWRGKFCCNVTKGTSIFQEGWYHSAVDEGRVGLFGKKAKNKEVNKE